MYLPHWFWCVRFRTSNGGGETYVVAPHRAGAKQAIATPAERVMAYESVAPHERIPPSMAAQSFDGYYPRTRAAIDAGRMAIRGE
ncbi:hypothetical protein MUK72_13665 [Halococcus dombrowskii]|uniref:Uncharacterized protein n=1 Tax=Halococcus dombrowskii TaxID=179637 RepID=A0AAV3SFI0_HALDO|nr:hypothetical protein [Halococcus dombrowskii]UOO95002.1 hypothetical protein MUK72_13665 [Halococcus dombrowskii]